MEWFMENLGTIVIAAALILIVALIIRKMIRDKKNGKSFCGCDCSSCGGSCGSCGGCHTDSKKAGKN
jgi:hypothetical protein